MQKSQNLARLDTNPIKTTHKKIPDSWEGRILQSWSLHMYSEISQK